MIYLTLLAAIVLLGIAIGCAVIAAVDSFDGVNDDE